MSDPKLAEFHGRVARIKLARAKGYGFEAAGTLGRFHYTRPKAKRRSLLVPMVFLILCAFLLKGAIYHSVGAQSYNDRVSSLMAGKGIDYIGGWLMQADPVTKFASDNIALAMTKFK